MKEHTVTAFIRVRATDAKDALATVDAALERIELLDDGTSLVMWTRRTHECTAFTLGYGAAVCKDCNEAWSWDFKEKAWRGVE